MKRRLAATAVLLATLGALFFFYFVPGQFEAGINITSQRAALSRVHQGPWHCTSSC